MKRRLALGLALAAVAVPAAAVTIDGDFTDWGPGDLVALDGYYGMTLGADPAYGPCQPIDGGSTPAGTDPTYLFLDGYDDSRDLVAFYFHDDPAAGQVFFRVDFFDLKTGAEAAAGLDVYIVLDLAGGGEEWLPDFTDCRTSHPWDLALCLYDSAAAAVKAGDPGQPELPATLDGPRFQAQWDALEVGLERQLLIEHGWDGSSALNFQVFTTRDGTNGGGGEVLDHSDIADAFVDDDRGYSDGVLDGALASAGPRPGRAKWAVILDGTWPLAGERPVDALIDRSRDPWEPVLGVGLMRALETAEATGVPLELHLAGTMAMAIEWAAPEFNQRLRQDIAAGLVDLAGGPLAETILPFFHGPAAQDAIRLGANALTQIYEQPPARRPVFWTPQRTARGDLAGDILAASAAHGLAYQATVLDEATAHHDWFGHDNVWDGVPGNETAVDLDQDTRKLHLHDGLLLAFIDRHAARWKTETMAPTYYGCDYEPSLEIGTRARLLDLALAADQEQLLLCMGSWEEFAGAPPGSQPDARAPDGFDTICRWIACHPWIEPTTLSRILRGEVDTDGDGAGDVWTPVVDPPLTSHLPPHYGLPLPPYWLAGELPLTSHAWLRDAGEGAYGDDDPYPDPANVDDDPANDDWDDGYQNWIAGSPAEFGFREAVPALTGWQYDRAEAGGYPRLPLPGGRTFGALWDWEDGVETPSTEGIIAETWANLAASGGDPGLLEEAAAVFAAMTYRAGWHDEASVRSLTSDPQDDDIHGVLSREALAAAGHLRRVNVIVAAAEWAGSSPAPAAVLEAADLDLDGETEYVLKNNHVFLVFENDGGRLTQAFAEDPASGAWHEVIGASIVQPDRQGEDEHLDSWISHDPDREQNRCSAFRDQGYVNAEFGLVPGAGRLTCYSPDVLLKKRYTLYDDSWELLAEYEPRSPLSSLRVEFGLAPNALAAALAGKAAYEEIGGPLAPVAGLRNTAGGQVYVELGQAGFVHWDETDDGLALALTRRLVIGIEGNTAFKLGFGDDWQAFAPEVLGVALGDSPFEGAAGGELRIEAWVQGDDLASVGLYFWGTSEAPLATPLHLLELADDGSQGDAAAGDRIYSFALPLAGGLQPARYLLAVQAVNGRGQTSAWWPFLEVAGGGGTGAGPFGSAGGGDPAATAGEGDRFGGPAIVLGGYYATQVGPDGGQMNLFVQVEHPDGQEALRSVELRFAGLPTGVLLQPVGNSLHALSLTLPAGVPAGSYLLEVQAHDAAGRSSNLWPYWEIR